MTSLRHEASQPLGAEGLPPGVELPIPPPIDFDPLNEEDEVLIKHGFPCRPPPSSSEEELIQWKSLCSGIGSYVTPTFEAAAMKADAQSKTETTINWSGARIDNTDKYKFFKVEGSWVVSRPHPRNEAWETKGWAPGRFTASSWVGMGGHSESHVLQAGVAHRCTTSYHQDTVYETLAWFEWIPDDPWFLRGFQVAQGDLVKVQIEASGNNKRATFRFYNISAGTFTIFFFKSDNALNGNSAEWIVEGHAHAKNMSYLGATFFFDCQAWEKKVELEGGEKADKKTRDLSGATYLTMEQDNVVRSAGLPQYSNGSVLGVLATRNVSREIAHRRRRDSGTK